MTRTFTPGIRSSFDNRTLGSIILTRNVIRQSLVRTVNPLRDLGPAELCRPRFSFFNLQFSKNRHRRRGVVARFAFGFGPVECRSRGSHDFVQLRETQRRTSLSPAASPPSLVMLLPRLRLRGALPGWLHLHRGVDPRAAGEQPLLRLPRPALRPTWAARAAGAPGPRRGAALRQRLLRAGGGAARRRRPAAGDGAGAGQGADGEAAGVEPSALVTLPSVSMVSCSATWPSRPSLRASSG